MTTNYPAHTRPPPIIPPPPDLFHPPRRRPSIVNPEIPQSQKASRPGVHYAETDGGDRAVKRRKLESPKAESKLGPQAPTAAGDDAGKVETSVSSLKLSRIARDIPESDLMERDAEDEGVDVAAALPFPRRPWKNAPTTKPTVEENKVVGRIRKKIPVPNTPDKLESPAAAPKFGRCVGKCALAGFFPWTGKHPEDVLNESTAKHGYYDRPPSQLEKEQGSVKTTMHHTFKHKSGLETLSALFSTVLEQRNKQATISSSSAFKPPPRVTLTETKRKSWLTDLANVEVSLRKLSKTVPQGIRGQALLDQCLLNSVSITRAIWFAKCVGANEIRIMKRAKPSGNVAISHEVKWLKDWTLNVEQFIETALRQCGQPGWRNNIQYVLRLCTRLYLENLMDRDHYLDWIVKSLAAAGHDQLPFWLMVIHIYYRDLIRFRKRGKKLAELLLEKMGSIKTEQLQLLQPLLLRLKTFIRQFALARPSCFLMPDQWPQVLGQLEICLQMKSADDQRLFMHLKSINERSLGSNKLLHTAGVPIRQKLIKILDATKGRVCIPTLSQACIDVADNQDVMVSTVLEWATTRFRHSHARLYVAVRLLRRWHQVGYDIEPQLFEFIGKVQKNDLVDYEQYHHLISELSRSKTFSASKYMQWLTINGGLRKDCFEHISTELERERNHATPQQCHDSSQVLTHISLGHLDDHVKNLRDITLRRAGFDLTRESTVTEHCKLYLAARMPVIAPQPPHEAPLAKKPNFASLPWTVKSELSQWLRSLVNTYLKPSKSRDTDQEAPGAISLPLHELWSIRSALEEMGDLAVLADVLTACAVLPQEDLLASVADTAFHRSEVLSAIGAFEDIHNKLCHAYTALRTVNRSMPLLATSMLSLCRHRTSTVVSLRTILTDFGKGDRMRAVTACSPFSDGVAESLQQAGETFLEDFEVILQSEPNMNEETLQRLFIVLTGRIDKTSGAQEDPNVELALCQLLARLRLHRPTQCDQLIARWLMRLLTESRASRSALITQLVATGCITFDVLAQSVKQILSEKHDFDHAKVPVWVEHFSFDDSEFPWSQAEYRMNLCRRKYASENPVELLSLASDIKSVLGVELRLTSVLPGLISAIVLEGLPLSQLATNEQSALFVRGLDLLSRSIGKDDQNGPSIASIAKSVDDLSLPFCQARLQLLVDESGSEQSSTDGMANDFFAVAQKEALEDDQSKTNCFALLQEVSPEIATRARELAEEAFLASFPAILQPKSFVSESKDGSCPDITSAQRYLNIAFGVAQAASSIRVAATIPQIIDKLSNTLRLLGSTNTAPAAAASPIAAIASAIPPTSMPAHSEHLSTVLQYLPLLLQITCLERPLPSPPGATSTKQTQQDQVKLLVLLVSIALHPALAETSIANTDADNDLPSFALDVAATLVENISDEARLLCARFLKDKMRDPRVTFLFGSIGGMGSVLSAEIGAGLRLIRGDGSGSGSGRDVGEWKPRVWEVLQGGAEAWVGIGVLGGRRG